MRIEKLKIENLRNISDADIDFSEKINFLKGANGAGKTTVLEAIYLLARSKSFTKGTQKTVVQQGKGSMTLYLVGSNRKGEKIRVGLQKTKNITNIKLNGNPVKKLSEIVKAIPISLITPQTYKILDEGPEFRRRLINWGVFHVEHQFANVARKYTRALAQRNQALKGSSRDIDI